MVKRMRHRPSRLGQVDHTPVGEVRRVEAKLQRVFDAIVERLKVLRGEKHSPRPDYAAEVLHIRQPPMITVGSPITMPPPCAVMSPCRAAGMKPIITVVDPMTITSGPPAQ